MSYTTILSGEKQDTNNVYSRLPFFIKYGNNLYLYWYVHS